jgi:long-chain acyl-CoA synthetase
VQPITIEPVWNVQYDKGMPRSIELERANALDMFLSSVERSPDSALLHYLDSTLTVSEVDRLSDALAVGLAANGIARGDRVAMYLQNMPQYVIAMIATWKLGAIVAAVNPMYREKEVLHILTDSGAKGIVCLESLYRDVVQKVRDASSLSVVITTSELDFVASPQNFSVLDGITRERAPKTLDFVDVTVEYVGQKPPPIEGVGPSDVACLTYTSGTTGTAKGAMNTHGNIVFNAQSYRDWINLSSEDTIFGVAPLFHITGLVGHMALAMLTPMPLVLMYRFNAAMVLEQIERWKATFTIGSITVFTALMNEPTADNFDISSLKKIYTGGQGVAPSTVAAFEAKFGAYIHIAYGLTETTSPSHFVPLNGRSPVDKSSGALSVGVPIFDTLSTIVDEEGREVPPGTVGEIIIKGPQVVPGYWQNPEESANAFKDSWLFTGDVGLMDEEGWFYVVDRKKDLINASGYKIWPKEVEDALMQHPSVLEAAVIGVPDEYRGETVKGFVSLKVGMHVEPDELKKYCREIIASYKCPSEIEILDDLPKNVAGKILRRELRDRETGVRTVTANSGFKS